MAMVRVWNISDHPQTKSPGLTMMVFPIMVHSLLWLWLIAGACVAVVVFVPDGS